MGLAVPRKLLGQGSTLATEDGEFVVDVVVGSRVVVVETDPAECFEGSSGKLDPPYMRQEQRGEQPAALPR